jgi:hypothetical protein
MALFELDEALIDLPLVLDESSFATVELLCTLLEACKARPDLMLELDLAGRRFHLAAERLAQLALARHGGLELGAELDQARIGRRRRRRRGQSDGFAR